MSFSLKRKALDQAQKYIQKGAFDKALKEYVKHLQSEPDDTNARLKLGDLHLKRGDQGAAIEAYGQVAEQFSKTGFDAKAVAIYKQILRIDSSYLDARVQLGDHFQRMGLASDALREFQEAVKICQDRGLKREGFDLLKRVAALDPANVPNRLSLADLLLREKLVDEAREEYISLIDEVAERGEQDLVARVSKRLMDAFPDDETGFVRFAKAKAALGEPDAAQAALNQALPRFSESISIREALIDVHQARGDQESIRSAYREIAEIHKRRGDHDAARDILQRHVPVEAFGGDDDAFSSPSIVLSEEAEQEFQVEDPSFDSAGLDFSGDNYDETGEIELIAEDTITDIPISQAEELLAEARVSLEFDDAENAARLARQVLELEPDLKTARDLLAQAEAAGGAAAPAAAPQAKDPAAPPGFDDSLPDIELVLEDEGDSDDEFVSIEPPTQIDLGPIPNVAGDSLETGDSDDDSEDEFEIEFEAETPVPEIEPPAEELAGEEDSGGWASHSTFIGKRLDHAELLYEEGKLDEAEAAFREVLEKAPHHPQALVRVGELAARRGEDPAGLAEVGGSIDQGETHIEAGPLDIPEVELSDAARPAKAGKAKKVKERSKRSAKTAETEVEQPEPQLELDDEPFELVDDPLELEEGPQVDLGSDLEAELASLTEEAAADIEGDVEPMSVPSMAIEQLDEEPELAEPQLAEPEALETAEAALVEDGEDAEGGGLFEPSELLEDDDEPETDDGAGFDLAAALDDEESLDMESSGVGFEEVFRAFKKGIQEQIGEEEIEAHYDLAIAYKEMGLLDDAVQELELVRKSEAFRIEGLGLMATCKLELGRPEEAAGHLSEALALVDEGDESVVSLRYDLGEALLAAGKNSQALDAFKKVSASDSEFREVQERLAELDN